MNGQAKEPLMVRLVSKEDLYAANISAVKDGGLFIHTKRQFEFGERVLIDLELMDEIEHYLFEADIIWITPLGAQGGMVPGIGVRLEGDKGAILYKKINTYLAGMERSDKATDTL